MTNNKIHFGLRNVYYAKMIDDDSYETPVALKGAVSLSLKHSGSSETVYADDAPYAELATDNGFTGTLEMPTFAEQFKTDILNFELDDNGVLSENADNTTNYFALIYEVQGDKHATRHVLYRCKAEIPDEDNATKEEKPKVNNIKLSFTAYPSLGTGWINHRVHASIHSYQTEYDEWFSKVYIGTVTPLGTLTITSEAGSTTGKTKLIVTPTLTSGNAYVYKVGASAPTVNAVCTTVTGYTPWDGAADITADADDSIVVVEVDTEGRAKKAGTVKAVVE